MKKNIYALTMIIVLLIISLFVIIIGSNYIQNKEKELLQEKYENLSSNFKNKINSLIEKKKNATLVLTIALSENRDIISMFRKQNTQFNLNDLSLRLRKNTDFKNVWFQLIDKNGVSIHRSWTNEKDDRIDNIRADVKSMLVHQEIKNTISVGRYDLTFKSMVPIYDNKKFVGILESITHFNSISRGLSKNDNLESIILVDKKYTNQLKKSSFTKIFLQNHYVANLDIDKDLLKYLENENINEILSIKNFKVKDENIIVNSPILFNNEVLGNFLSFKKISEINTEDIEDFKKHVYWYLILSILLLFMFLSVVSYYLYSKQLKKLYDKLDKNREKLHFLNKNLEKTVEEEILKNDEKNKILFQQAKMAAMGEMIENIAHQWRQPLSIITVGASAIKLKKELNDLDDKEHLEYLNTIINTSNYLSNTIDDFRFFFSPNKSKNEFNSEELIEKSLKLLQSSYTENSIKVIENIEKHKIYCYENELIQVLINVLNNAKDELIKIEKFENRYLFIDLYKENKEIIIKIKDNAGGIKEEVIDRVFEPYFTTKHKSNGTGIGLYMCEEIITKHISGQIIVTNNTYTYENNTYTGAEFRISIPIK